MALCLFHPKRHHNQNGALSSLSFFCHFLPTPLPAHHAERSGHRPKFFLNCFHFMNKSPVPSPLLGSSDCDTLYFTNKDMRCNNTNSSRSIKRQTCFVMLVSLLSGHKSCKNLRGCLTEGHSVHAEIMHTFFGTYTIKHHTALPPSCIITWR